MNNNIIKGIFCIIAVAIIMYGLSYMISNDDTKEITKCYDRNAREIIGQSCIKTMGDTESIVMAIATSFIIILTLATLFFITTGMYD